MGRYRDLTIRTEPCAKCYGRDIAIYLYKKPIVVYMPTRSHPWRKGKLTGVLPANDSFRVTWSNGRYSNLKGLWRIHTATLFTGGRLPVPHRSAKLHSSTQHNPRRVSSMATKPKSRTKKGAASSNGTKISELSSAERRKMAAEIKQLRKDKVPWDGPDGICDQLGLGSALQGRNLLREFGGENLIREQERTASSKPAAKKAAGRTKAATKKTGASRRKVTVKRGKGRAANPS